VRRLIINADDFGLTAGVNHAIVECHRAGSVTSATLMAGSQAFAQAVELAQAYPKLGVGCHVVLVDGAPLAPVADVSSLLAPGTHAFRRSAGEFAKAAVQRRIASAEIAAEASAQIRKLQEAGLRLTHVDTHKHTHIFPVALKAVLIAAKEAGVGAIRNPFAPLHVISKAAVAKQPALWLRYMQVKMLSRYAGGFRRAVKDAGLQTTDGAFGVIATGILDEKLLRAILDSIPDGTWELVCHPGYNDAALAGVNTRLRQSRVLEREVLTAPQIHDEILQRGIELITFAEI
jgi:hopanoid biosynthesis associated protein HpnK